MDSDAQSATSRAVKIVRRAEWGARPPQSISRLQEPVTYAFIHHSAGTEPKDLESGKRTVRSIQNYHMDTQKWSDIGYTFLIGGDGSVFEGRGWGIVGAHTMNYNSTGYGFCFLGTFTNSLPTLAARNAAKALIAEAAAAGRLKKDYKLKGHRQMGSTECPGTALYNEIKTWPHFSP
ncbi:hypothetical protein RvY_14268 [Ramazzottius varieornatus]|uniref:Peptidoglycan-recognition protein n=1 Tax=Ramazzottius varieornatus TaxID=947166 RepID=A0A1D1VUL9_RAMVA|nr:hypothetical protein RvY_14268 [Ramazzottius varieornatus]